MKKLMMSVVFAASMSAFASATIERMVARQLWPWSTDVQVDFVLTDVASPVDISVSATDNGSTLDLSGRVSGDMYALSETGAYKIRIKTDGLFASSRTVTDKFRVTLTTGDSDASYATVLYKIFDLDTGAVENVTVAKLLSGSYEGVETDGQSLASGTPIDVNRVRWCGVTNDTQYATTKLVMRYVKAAGESFMMGTNVVAIGLNEGEMGSDRTQWIYNAYAPVGEETRHQVSFSRDYYIGVFEVTQWQYNKMTSKWPSKFNNADYRDVRPVEQVSYADATDSFLPALNSKTSKAFALPTEAQWEFACRAGTTTGLNSGKDVQWALRNEEDPYVSEVARNRFNANVTSPMSYTGGWDTGTARVGMYLCNAWGIYDMHGNVAEWCRDWFKSDLGANAVQDPEITSATEAGTYRAVRNSGWNYVAGAGCINGSKRSAFRWGKDPSANATSLGFRVMLPAE